MASIFKDTEYAKNKALMRFFKETAFGAFSGATTTATAKYIGSLGETANKLFLDNQTNAEVYVVLVNPNLDYTDVANREVLISIGAGQQYSIEAIAPPHLSVPAKTGIMLFAPVAPTSGKFKVFAFPG